MNLQETLNHATLPGPFNADDLKRLSVIATTIKQQIGVNTLMCIGASDLRAIKETEKRMGGLMLKINPNPNIRGGGHVVVELMPSDTYKVSVFNNRGNLFDSKDDVYCDELATSIMHITG